MTSEPDPPLDPLEALRIIQVLVDGAEAADNPSAADLILREVRNVLALALPKKPKRRLPEP